MNIEVGKWYENKTWRFLLPCIKGHGNLFVSKFNSVFKLGVGIHDTLLDGTDLANGRNILILCDKKVKPKDFNMFLNWVKEQTYFKGDYCPDGNFKTSRKHVIILEVPKEYYKSYDNFLKGEYSNMYNSKQLEFLFSAPNRKNELEILNKTSKAAENLIKKIEKEFFFEVLDTISKNDLIDCEYELPLVRKQEIFNCENNERVYFNEEADKNWLVEEEVDDLEEILEHLKNNEL